ncbi:MAG: hypothetical protein A3K65_07930 [Euryarchaeota archaeon RBG_16_68_12]|nr:MAG: hypothetical protein A3K65_07930 [Euryarchaeota archaeon RBG_16_68_12]
MKVNVEIGDISRWEDEAVVVNLFEGVEHPGGATGAVDAAMGHQIASLIATGDVSGKFKDVAVLPTFDRIPANRVLVVGLGKRNDFTMDRVREVSARGATKVREIGLKTFATVVHGAGVGDLDLGDATEAVVEGTLLGLYRYTEHKTEPEKKRVEAMTILNMDKARGNAIRDAVHRASVLASTVNFVRDLVNAPSNAKTPTVLADRFKAAAREAGARCTVVNEDQAAKLGFGGLLGVARGSDEPPRFVVVEWGGGGRAKPIVLVGKGITFDTGGISLKPQEGMLGPMWEMKTDMSGAAAAVGAVLAAARLKLPLNVVAMAPLSENMPSGKAQKPGDVLKAYGGITVEVENTDAEGRLVLADALAYAKERKPQAIVDLATLTGSCVFALGKHAAGLFATDPKLRDRIVRAGETVGERVWELPLWDEYEEQIKSDVADVKNTGGRYGGAITAARFLRRFAEGVPWAHLDIAGVAFIGGGPENPKKEYLPKGASGWGVRLLVRMLQDWT